MLHMEAFGPPYRVPVQEDHRKQTHKQTNKTNRSNAVNKIAPNENLIMNSPHPKAQIQEL